MKKTNYKLSKIAEGIEEIKEDKFQFNQSPELEELLEELAKEILKEFEPGLIIMNEAWALRKEKEILKEWKKKIKNLKIAND